MAIDKGRLESLSDGIISVSLTLMLYQITIPDEFTVKSILKDGYFVIGYVLSFVYVGVYWINHHYLFMLLKKVNAKIIWFNLNLLFWLTMIPLSSTWIVKAEFAAGPMSIYAFTLFACCASYGALVWVICREESCNPIAAELLRSDKKINISLVMYGLAVVIAGYSPWLTFGLLTVMALVWFLPSRKFEQYLTADD